MLRIYWVCLEMVKNVRKYVEMIARLDRDLARQLRKSSTSVPLNVAEGSGGRGGKRRHSYDVALCEARETWAVLEVAVSAGYVREIDTVIRQQLNQIIGTLVNLTR